MRKTLQMISVLTIVGLISGAMLVFMYNYANPLILNNQKNEMEGAIFKIFPEANTYEKDIIEDNVIFRVKDKSGKLLGYAFLAKGNGYQGAIKMMAGIKPDLETLVGIEILESQETPGLGQEITNDEFKAQFKGLTTSPEITYVKHKPPERPNGTQTTTGATVSSSKRTNEIRAITGATVSSSAVCSILNEKIERLRSLLR